LHRRSRGFSHRQRRRRPASATRPLANSRAVFLRLLDVVRSLDTARVERPRAGRDYQALKVYVLDKLMGW
jgi:hypothetical protein